MAVSVFHPSMVFVPFIVVVLQTVVFTEAGKYTRLSSKDYRNARTMPEQPANRTGEVPGMFEGDIDLAGKPLSYYKDTFPLSPDGTVLNAAQKDTSYQWPDRRVPYVVSDAFDKYQRSRIANAIKMFHTQTCIRFVPRRNEQDFVAFEKRIGCYSPVGRRGGKQDIVLAAYCLGTGTIQHEMLHALGFFHEQSRADRDDHVEIRWDNIRFNADGNFQKYSLDRITHLGTAYDLGSLLHYPADAFSKNGLPTIVTKVAGVEIGQQDAMSSTDIEEVNKLYQCPAGGSNPSVTECTDQFKKCKKFKKYCEKREELRVKCCKTCTEKQGDPQNGKTRKQKRKERRQNRRERKRQNKN